MIKLAPTQQTPEITLEGDTLSLRGAMTLAYARQLELGGDAVLRGAAVTADLAAATEIDSSALAVLFAWQRSQQKHAGSLSVRAAPEALRSLAQVYGVSDQLTWV